MKILITGAAGFLGSNLSKKLLSENHNLLGVDNFFRGSKKNLPAHENFIFIKQDLLDLEKTKEIFSNYNPELVIHYAAINGTRYFYDLPHKVCDENIRMTQNVLEASKLESVKKIIYASSSEVYGPKPIIPTQEDNDIILKSISKRDSYASSKALGEFLTFLWAEKNHKKYIIVRPFNTYGKNMVDTKYGQVIPEFIRRVKDKVDFTIAGDGKQTRSFCHVEDHTNILNILINSVDNEVLNIGYDEEITILKLAEKIHDNLNRNFDPKFLPEWENDTKWRVPSLTKLRGYIKDYKFITLEEGLKSIMK